MSQLLGNATTITLQPPELAAVDGSAETGTHRLLEVAGAKVGIWEVQRGTLSGPSFDEVFVVLSGSATITFPATGEVVEVGPGDIVKLESGAVSSWIVHTTLRKVYVNAGV